MKQKKVQLDLTFPNFLEEKKRSSRYRRIRRAADARTGQVQLLVLGGHGDRPRRHQGRLRGRQHRQIVVLLVHVRARPARLDPALEPPVVPAVRRVGDVQVVHSLVRPKVDSGRGERGEETK